MCRHWHGRVRVPISTYAPADDCPSLIGRTPSSWLRWIYPEPDTGYLFHLGTYLNVHATGSVHSCMQESCKQFHEAPQPASTPMIRQVHRSWLWRPTSSWRRHTWMLCPAARRSRSRASVTRIGTAKTCKSEALGPAVRTSSEPTGSS